jgi:hypothetical protein
VDGLVAQVPLGRAGQPEEIASIVAFLASSDSGWLTGELINASGNEVPVRHHLDSRDEFYIMDSYSAKACAVGRFESLCF